MCTGPGAAEPVTGEALTDTLHRFAADLVGAIREASQLPNVSSRVTDKSKEPGDLAKFMAHQVSGKDFPAFSGNPEGCLNFITTFRKTTEEGGNTTEEGGFSEQENLTRLNKALRGKAQETVVSLPAVPGSLQEVLRI